LTRIAVNRAHSPVLTLGPGRRAAIWFQGCSIGCKGCVSMDTWEPSAPGVGVDELVDWIVDCRDRHQVTGLTVSGGEPFQQPEGLAALGSAVRERLGDRFDVLSYSGYTMSWLKKHRAGVLQAVDAVMSGPYVQSKPTDLVWRGSANQVLTPTTPLGEEVFAPFVDALREGGSLQAMVDGGAIWYVGVPRPGEMDRIDTALRERGIHQEGVSWKA